MPDGVSDATVLVLKEIARIAGIVRKGLVRLVLSPAEYVKYWKAVNERTSSSRSKAHFEHLEKARLHQLYSPFTIAAMNPEASRQLKGMGEARLGGAVVWLTAAAVQSQRWVAGRVKGCGWFQLLVRA